MEQGKLAVAIGDDTVRFAVVGTHGALSRLEEWPIARFSTLTDALLTYEASSGVPLLGSTCGISIIGATCRDSILLSRGQWAISRAGLKSLFRHDAIVINDVAASAWAILGGQAQKLSPLSPGGSEPDFRRPGRWAVAHIQKGVGLAVIDVDEAGVPRVLECEMGHCGFSPSSSEHEALASALSRRLAKAVTWESILTIPLDDPIWTIDGVNVSRSKRVGVLARLAGQFVGEVVLAHGAWSGTIVTGKRIAEIVADPAIDGFNAAFEAKTKFQRLIRATPRWRLTNTELSLPGLAVALDLHPYARRVLATA
ncbi:glucokinase [uncultured Sphingomonas sp.]|uniref:glucokinase n=1 Tax=uncultured Sphingomonas sp. TaxID=158754 RepID=UPI0035CBF3F1